MNFKKHVIASTLGCVAVSFSLFFTACGDDSSSGTTGPDETIESSATEGSDNPGSSGSTTNSSGATNTSSTSNTPANLGSPVLTVSGTDLMLNGKKIFFSGTNLAWSDYNSDVGDSPLNENAWRKAVEGTRAAGGNAIRWWLFNNMSQSPTIDQTTHLVTGLK